MQPRRPCSPPATWPTHPAPAGRLLLGGGGSGNQNQNQGGTTMNNGPVTVGQGGSQANNAEIRQVRACAQMAWAGPGPFPPSLMRTPDPLQPRAQLAVAASPRGPKCLL